jgi:hypothetical protein
MAMMNSSMITEIMETHEPELQMEKKHKMDVRLQRMKDLVHKKTLYRTKMESEPDWTKSISSSTVCMYFYVMFFFVAVVSGLAVGIDLVTMTTRPKLGLMMLARSLPTLAIATLNALFLYILCARSLLK